MLPRPCLVKMEWDGMSLASMLMMCTVNVYCPRPRSGRLGWDGMSLASMLKRRTVRVFLQGRRLGGRTGMLFAHGTAYAKAFWRLPTCLPYPTYETILTVPCYVRSTYMHG